jgi:hypothetical protein
LAEQLWPFGVYPAEVVRAIEAGEIGEDVQHHYAEEVDVRASERAEAERLAQAAADDLYGQGSRLYPLQPGGSGGLDVAGGPRPRAGATGPQRTRAQWGPREVHPVSRSKLWWSVPAVLLSVTLGCGGSDDDEAEGRTTSTETTTTTTTTTTTHPSTTTTRPTTTTTPTRAEHEVALGQPVDMTYIEPQNDYGELDLTVTVETYENQAIVSVDATAGDATTFDLRLLMFVHVTGDGDVLRADEPLPSRVLLAGDQASETLTFPTTLDDGRVRLVDRDTPYADWLISS